MKPWRSPDQRQLRGVARHRLAEPGRTASFSRGLSHGLGLESSYPSDAGTCTSPCYKPIRMLSRSTTTPSTLSASRKKRSARRSGRRHGGREMASGEGGIIHRPRHRRAVRRWKRAAEAEGNRSAGTWLAAAADAYLQVRAKAGHPLPWRGTRGPSPSALRTAEYSRFGERFRRRSATSGAHPTVQTETRDRTLVHLPTGRIIATLRRSAQPRGWRQSWPRSSCAASCWSCCRWSIVASTKRSNPHGRCLYGLPP